MYIFVNKVLGRCSCSFWLMYGKLALGLRKPLPHEVLVLSVWTAARCESLLEAFILTTATEIIFDMTSYKVIQHLLVFLHLPVQKRDAGCCHWVHSFYRITNTTTLFNMYDTHSRIK